MRAQGRKPDKVFVLKAREKIHSSSNIRPSKGAPACYSTLPKEERHSFSVVMGRTKSHVFLEKVGRKRGWELT